MRVAVGQRTTWTFDLADLAPGLSCVATVTGQLRVTASVIRRHSLQTTRYLDFDSFNAVLFYFSQSSLP